MTRRLPILAALGLMFGMYPASVARAEPIQVTSGGLTVAWDDPSSFGFFGTDGFALTGLFIRVPSSPQQSCFTSCTPGTTVNLSGVAGGGTGFTLGQSMTAVVNGVEFATPTRHETWLNLMGTFFFESSDVVLPPMTDVMGGIGVTAPFSFHGRVAGFAPGDTGATSPLFEVDLLGHGTATLNMRNSPQGVYRFPEVHYTFEALEPVPEPATVLLIATGIAGVLRCRARVIWLRARSSRNTPPHRC